MKDDVQDSKTGDGLPQRQALRALLNEGEQKVPSTTANIMAAIRREQQTTQKVAADASHNIHSTPSSVPFPQVRAIETPRPKRARRTLYSALALTAVAAALIASFGLLKFILPLHSSSVSSGAASSNSSPEFMMTKYPSFVPGTTSTWSAVIITYKIHRMTIIANYDPVATTSTILVSLQDVDAIVDGVSHDGREVLYSVYDGSKTSYYIYPQATKHAIFTTPDKSRSAIWSTDDRSLFISTARGILSVDVQTYTTKLLFPTLPSVTLLNYRNDGYLYFIKGDTGQAYATQGTLNRINVAQGNSQQITPCTRGTHFWLSPDGATAYYNCLDQNANILYSVNSDGANPSIFRSNGGNVIGYAVDGSPLTLENANGKYQVVQRDMQSAQDTVLIQDVAPGTTPITADDVAVAPYGHVLVAKGMYSNNGAVTKEQLWYSNLDTGASKSLALPQTASTPQAIGWDKLQVLGEMLTPAP